MPLHQTKWLTERPVLRALIGGFALVVILLGLADVAAVRSTGKIEDDTRQVIGEQLVMARLLNDVQAEQNTLAAVLHQMAHMPETINREALLRSLENADRQLARSARAAAETSEAHEWKMLENTVREFSADVARVIREQQQPSPETLSRLIARHDDVVQLEQDLLDQSEQRVTGTETSIEHESQQLAQQIAVAIGNLSCPGTSMRGSNCDFCAPQHSTY